MAGTRPELDADSEWIIENFTRRKTYKSAKETIRAALEALYEKHMLEDAAHWDESSGGQNDEIMNLQFEDKSA